MKLFWKQGSQELLVEGGPTFGCSCEVRNELNRRRSMGQVVRSIPDNRPIMPRIFPAGEWNVGRPEPRSLIKDKDTYPWYIPTDAWQELPEWSLDPEGRYDRPTARMVKDKAYGLHWCIWSRTTIGCIRIASMGEVEALALLINAAHDRGEPVKLIVEEGS